MLFSASLLIENDIFFLSSKNADKLASTTLLSLINKFPFKSDIWLISSKETSSNFIFKAILLWKILFLFLSVPFKRFVIKVFAFKLKPIMS